MLQKFLDYVFVLTAVDRTGGVRNPLGFEFGCVEEEFKLEFMQLLYSLSLLLVELAVTTLTEWLEVFLGVFLSRATISEEVSEHAWTWTAWIKQYKLHISIIFSFYFKEIPSFGLNVRRLVLWDCILKKLESLWTFLEGKYLAFTDIFSKLYSFISRGWACINDIKLFSLPLFLHAFEEQEGREGAAEALHHTSWAAE